jgi:hypothetical protein
LYTGSLLLETLQMSFDYIIVHSVGS